MDQGEIKQALENAFNQCEQAGYPLEEIQKQILLQISELAQLQTAPPLANTGMNPLDDLTPAERQRLLEHIHHCEREGLDWKICLLNDWLAGNSSGMVQFIRDRYGPTWLEQVHPFHLAAYSDGRIKVKLGDRLEVSNTLWEWIPDPQAQEREWYACRVIRVFESSDGDRTYLNCTVRLENGSEYDIYGMDDWNHYNWRWPSP
uniref:Uncharacterized protein n=1 Tax=Cyanothece sp. (strain PCC 7425 / ATCC 29141) TaxID=395961 RepID=B8HXN4_CYAP4